MPVLSGLAILLCLGTPGGVQAVDAEGFSSRLSTTLLGYGRFSLLRDLDINPDNQVLQLPTLSAGTELRPDLRFMHGNLIGVVRPRFTLVEDVREGFGGSNAIKFDLNGTTYYADWDADVTISDFYVQYTLSPTLTVSYGLQNFQWGHAEFLNASNRIFHINGLQRDALFLARGRNLLRINGSLGQYLSLVGLLELRDNDEAIFGADESFDRKGLLKLELTSLSGAHYVGLVGGTGQTTKPWLGQYGALEALEGITLYFDASETRGSRAWYPEESSDTGFISMAQRELESDDVEVLGVFGARYAFPQGSDLSLEYVLNTAGYTDGELDLAVRGATEPSPYTVDNLEKFFNPGLEIHGQQLLYLSARVNDVVPRLDDTLLFRYLWSVTDRSGYGYAYFDLGVTDSDVVFASVGVHHGDEDSELAIPAWFSVTGGLEHSW